VPLGEEYHYSWSIIMRNSQTAFVISRGCRLLHMYVH
jgi:hypothetical protein